MPLAPRTRRALVLGAGAGTAAISLRALVRPRAAGDRRLLDWNEVSRVADRRIEETAREYDPAELGARYDAIAADLAPHMAPICGGVPAGYPPFTVLDRRGVVLANLDILRRMLEPVEQLRSRIPDSRLTGLMRRGLDRYMGELLAFMAHRVLGQYDPVLLLVAEPEATSAPPSLFLVEPNIEAFARQAGAPGASLRRWLILHELTHAWQFETHPWLGRHLTELMNNLLMSGLVGTLGASEGRRHRLSPRAAFARLPQTLHSQWESISRLQAVMSVLEGHGNFVMHRVGRREIADSGRLEAAFEARRRQRSTQERLILAVTGMNLKLRQYDLGERFSEAAVEHGGLELLNRVWEGPALMPTMEELRLPQRWFARVA